MQPAGLRLDGRSPTMLQAVRAALQATAPDLMVVAAKPAVAAWVLGCRGEAA
jgi:hypothetical protein